MTMGKVLTRVGGYIAKPFTVSEVTQPEPALAAGGGYRADAEAGHGRDPVLLMSQLAHTAVSYLWQGPPHLPRSVRLEWRFIALRWAGILFVAPGLLLANLPDQQLVGAYVVPASAAVYNLVLQLMLTRVPGVFANGYVTTVFDAALNVAMVVVAGGFDSPFYYILYTVTISAAMRYGYGPAIAMTLVFVTFDLLEDIGGSGRIQAPFVFRSGFLLITGILAGYLREQAMRAEAALQERLDQARALNQELESFAYSVSHDLRAPLRSIDGFSHALLEEYGEGLDDDGQDYLRRVRAASQRMGQLIDDLLGLSRLTRSELHFERVDLSSIAGEVVAGLRERDPEREVELLCAKGLVARGGPRLLRVLVENLLENAWKFTSKQPQARIEFGAMHHNGGPAYFVRDDGAGFDMAFAHKLFGAFQRLHGMTEFEGTGIGLATVQRIIHRHGGNVWAEGEVGKGATFYFALQS